MPRYHVRAIPANGKPPLYLARQFRDGHDGPFTESYANRTTWGTASGPNRQLFVEEGRLPNKYYGDLAFVVVEESDPATCSNCESAIRSERPEGGDTRWVDGKGNDVCGWGGGDEPHETPTAA